DSFSAAVGLFNKVINFIVLFFVNKLAQKTNESSLW
ncbi:sugar ABC transporter permease, partial [Klebsiella pneumoniae]